MSIDVEIYQQASKVIEDENYKHVNVERMGDDLIITVHQMFAADRSLESTELLRMAGFQDVEHADTIPRARMIWQHNQKAAWQVTAMCMAPEHISLAIEWPIQARQDPREFREGLRALNRVFNTFRAKMEKTCDPR